MKIVINAMSARLGGGQTYILNLLAHLPARVDLELLVFAPDDLELPADPRIRRVRTAWPTTNPLLRAVWEKLLLPFYLRSVGADVLFCPGGVLATRPQAPCKTVTMFRNMMPFDASLIQRMPQGLQRLRNLILRRVMLKSMANADLTIFISDYARGVIESQIRVPRAVTIPHGINERFRTSGRSLPRPTTIPLGEYLLYVSRFDLYKHHHEVVTGYSQLPPGLRERYSLVLVGETNLPEAQHVQARIAELGLGHRVLTLGAIRYTELPAYYNNAAATIFASSCENCPNILLEALGAGRPVLSSDVMPMPEFGGDAVEYFSPTDPASIRDALLRVLGSDVRLQRLAEAAAARSHAYDWARTAASTWQSILALGPK